jgi:hypothetical protein
VVGVELEGGLLQRIGRSGAGLGPSLPAHRTCSRPTGSPREPKRTTATSVGMDGDRITPGTLQHRVLRAFKKASTDDQDGRVVVMGWRPLVHVREVLERCCGIRRGGAFDWLGEGARFVATRTSGRGGSQWTVS